MDTSNLNAEEDKRRLRYIWPICFSLPVHCFGILLSNKLRALGALGALYTATLLLVSSVEIYCGLGRYPAHSVQMQIVKSATVGGWSVGLPVIHGPMSQKIVLIHWLRELQRMRGASSRIECNPRFLEFILNHFSLTRTAAGGCGREYC